MDLFIDKANLISLLSSKTQEDNKETYWDCRRLMSRQLHLFYNFPKPYSNDVEYPSSSNVDGAGWDEDVPNSDVLFDDYFNQLQQYRGKKEYDDTFCETIEDFDSACNKSIFKVYLLDDSLNHNIDRNNVLVGNVGKEITTLKKLFCGDDYDLHQLYDLQSETSFPNWEQFEKDGHIFPTRDIVIFDRYLISFFTNKDGVKKYDKRNFTNICDILSRHCLANTNIFVFTLSSFDNITEYQKIKQSISDKLKARGIHLSLILIPDYQADKERYPKENKIDAPHDRLILTNYRLIRSGDSYNYFRQDGTKQTKGKSLDVDSIAKAEITDYANTLINELSALYHKVLIHCNNYEEDRTIGPLSSSMIKMEESIPTTMEAKKENTLDDLRKKFMG